jgi:hypothetical protein
MTAWVTSPASSVSFMMRSSLSVSGGSVLLSSSQPTSSLTVLHASSMAGRLAQAAGPVIAAWLSVRGAMGIVGSLSAKLVTGWERLTT